MPTKLNLTGIEPMSTRQGLVYVVDDLTDIPLFGSIVILDATGERGIVIGADVNVGGWGKCGFVVQPEHPGKMVPR